MINAYSYYSSEADKLNEFVLAFFDRIEFETSDFSKDFFEKEFYDNLVSRHKGILLKAFKDIYEITKTWTQKARTRLCEDIRKSNEIEEICKGNIIPTRSAQVTKSLELVLVKLFKQLYTDVLFGEFFEPYYGDRKTHYHDFLKFKTNDYEWCPSCGIRPMHRFTEEITDQYDHYLPKDIYPFSSVNFKNLIPICSDCNSIQVKSNNDILIHTGKVYYPFNKDHKAIKIAISITKDHTDLDEIQWGLNYACEAGKNNELDAWKKIYKIEDRHKKYCNGNAKTWYKNYWIYFTDKDSISEQPDNNKRRNSYLRTKKSNQFEHDCLSILTTRDTAIIASQIASRY